MSSESLTLSIGYLLCTCTVKPVLGHWHLLPILTITVNVVMHYNYNIIIDRFTCNIYVWNISKRIKWALNSYHLFFLEDMQNIKAKLKLTKCIKNSLQTVNILNKILYSICIKSFILYRKTKLAPYQKYLLIIWIIINSSSNQCAWHESII